MKRNSSKESLDDYFWDDLDDTGGKQIEESFINLLTKSKTNMEEDSKVRAECTNGAVTFQGLIHEQDSYPSEAAPVHVYNEVKKEGSVFVEVPCGHLDPLPTLGSEMPLGSKRIAQRPDKTCIEDFSYDSKASVENATSIFTDPHTSEGGVFKHSDKERKNHVPSPSGDDNNVAGPYEDNNELPSFCWENGEEGDTGFESKLSLLTLNAKLERGSEYSSLLNKFSTEAFLCSMSEASHNTDGMLGVTGSKETEQNSPYSFEGKSSVDIAMPRAPYLAENEADGEKVAEDRADVDIRGDATDSVKEAAEEKYERGEPHKVLSGRETLIPKSGRRELVADDFGFNFREYPRILYLQGRLLMAHSTKQKRLDVRSRVEREFVSTLFSFFALDYRLPSILNLDCSLILENEPMLSVLFSKNTTIDQIICTVNPGRIKYVVSDIGDSKGNANDLIEMFFLNREIAIKHALSNRQWTFALFLAHNTRHQDEVRREFSKHLNPILHPFFGYGEMSNDWRQTFSLLLRNPQDHLIDMLLSGLHDTEFLFVVLSFYFAHSRQFSSRHFFNNFCFLKLMLRYSVESKDLDHLILRYLRVMQEEGKDDTYKVYHKYKNRKGVCQWVSKKSWFEGIRDVMEKGISRIVGIDEDIFQQDDGHESVYQGQHDNQMIENKRDTGHIHYKHMDILPGQQVSREGQAAQYYNRGQHTYASEGTREIKCLQQVETTTNVVDGTNNICCKDISQTHIGKVEGRNPESTEGGEIPQNGAVLYNKGAQTGKGTREMHGDSKHKLDDINAEQHALKTWSSVYMNEERSKSCANHCSLLPADMLQEEESTEDGRNDGGKRTGFFSIFSIFSKKKTYKVNLNSREDFKYDPVSKKWTGCTSTYNESSPPVPAKKETPKPSMVKVKRINVTLDGSIKSRYANNVNADGEKCSFVSLHPEKK